MTEAIEPRPLPKELIRHGAAAADMIAIGFPGSGHELTKAIVTEALRCLVGNGLIKVVPKEEWPEYVAMDPPYVLPDGWGG